MPVVDSAPENNHYCLHFITIICVVYAFFKRAVSSTSCHLKVWARKCFPLILKALGEGSRLAVLSHHPLTCPVGDLLKVNMTCHPDCFRFSSSTKTLLLRTSSGVR